MGRRDGRAARRPGAGLDAGEVLEIDVVEFVGADGDLQARAIRPVATAWDRAFRRTTRRQPERRVSVLLADEPPKTLGDALHEVRLA